MSTLRLLGQGAHGAGHGANAVQCSAGATRKRNEDQASVHVQYRLGQVTQWFGKSGGAASGSVTYLRR